MLPISKLRAVSYLAPNWFEFYQAVVLSLERALSIETQLVQAASDPLDDPLLKQDQWDLGFICGLPFVRYQQAVPNQMRAIVAPVMQASRYQNRPIYFADVIVNAASEFNTFADLAGTTVCYNDPGSNSGYFLLCDRLRQETLPHFFGNAIQSGSHQRSIRWVVEGKADCAAIDSTVLEQECRLFPDLHQRLRVIESIGPCPMPPVVVAHRLGDDIIQQLQATLLKSDTHLQTAMERMDIARYAAVKSEDYEAIAQMFEAVMQAGRLDEGRTRLKQG
ncbi:PhnD/SsuA/transferrin family substrate-binding protein (plasmid) [Kovacikia minuta CCNUW1]|uniref:phosphate/phosphite/phosphonate ABC transporter substrate-binding protein n=1 Tax=Kovacikia minuta TaxID=2931930 RepID=UPI001CCB5B0F|nr:PhnD/SsuA/transferrin family substrate-binding protein [Kovacikia minuta]UBF30046.1 PhnD/SsuA/transferrin family substrate-binding protein [Kovacikia minuta CCNUW1]